MPRKPPRPCRHPGCPNLSHDVYCPEHRAIYARENAAERGYNGKWRKARGLFLQRNPLCVSCLKEDKITPAVIVDHIIPHRGDQALFWDQGNWQPLCKNHHDRKTGAGL